MTQRSDWKEPVQAIFQELTQLPSQFIQHFYPKLRQAMQESFEHPSDSETPLDPGSYQKAFIHSFQFYELSDAIKLIAHYDPTLGIEEGILPHIRKAIHSLAVIPVLEKISDSEAERQILQDYRCQLENDITQFLDCTRDMLYQASWRQQAFSQLKKIPSPPAKIQAFYRSRINSLFSKEYYTYLILRNHFFIAKLLQCSAEPELEQWLWNWINELCIQKPVSSLEAGLLLLDFRSIEQLVKSMVRQAVNHPTLVQSLSSLDVLENEPRDQPLRGPLEEPSTVLHLNSMETPSQAARTPFEELCFRYARLLLYMTGAIALVPECSSPYFRAKSEEYTTSVEDFFHDFFGRKAQAVADFKHFVDQVLRRTQKENPFSVVREQVSLYTQEEGQWQVSGTITREREWGVLLHGRLPYAVELNFNEKRNYKVEKGWKFIMHIGKAYFDYDHPQQDRAHSHDAGYFKVLFQGRMLSSHSAIANVGKTPYYMLTNSQLQQCRGVILLYLIALHSKFKIPMPHHLQNFLVEALNTR